MLKKMTSLVLAGVMALSLVACGSQDGGASTEPTPGGQVNAISYTIQLPRDRETVQVTVQVAGQTQYDKTLDTAQQLVVVTLKGSGTQEVTVYFDGQLDHSVSKDFG